MLPYHNRDGAPRRTPDECVAQRHPVCHPGHNSSEVRVGSPDRVDHLGVEVRDNQRGVVAGLRLLDQSLAGRRGGPRYVQLELAAELAAHTHTAHVAERGGDDHRHQVRVLLEQHLRCHRALLEAPERVVDPVMVLVPRDREQLRRLVVVRDHNVGVVPQLRREVVGALDGCRAHNDKLVGIVGDNRRSDRGLQRDVQVDDNEANRLVVIEDLLEAVELGFTDGRVGPEEA